MERQLFFQDAMHNVPHNRLIRGYNNGITQKKSSYYPNMYRK